MSSIRTPLLIPALARLRARLFGSASIGESAAQVTEVAPATKREYPAAISLPGQFSRVLAFQQDTNAAMELDRVSAGMAQHGATIGYRLDDVLVLNGSFYFRRGFRTFRPSSLRFGLRFKTDHFQEAQLCTSPVVERYFGHWLQDGLMHEVLASQRSITPLISDRKPWLHEKGYRHMLAVNAVGTPQAKVDKLWLTDDRGLNDNWLARFELLRSRARATASPTGPRGVWVRRGKQGASRSLVNEAEIESLLLKLGFEMLDPEVETAQRIVDKLAHVRVAVLVEGSALSHCLLAMPAGSTILTVQPPRRFNAVSKIYADPVKINWAFVVADETQGGFSLTPELLSKTLDEIERLAPTQPLHS